MIENPHEIIAEIQAKAFQNGWNALAQLIAEVIKTPTTPPKIEKPVKKTFKAGTAAAAIYDYVKSNPGQKGTEIINGSGIEGKTVRTALHRMKHVLKIAVNEDGRWRIL